MLIHFEDRPSDVAEAARIWRSHSEGAGTFQSMAACNWVMVVTRHQGKTFLTVRGPETQASVAECPAGGEWIGIHFQLGTFMPSLPNGAMSNRADVTLPDSGGRTFSLDGSAWEYPTFENADVFVKRLVKKGLVVADPLVQNALRGGSKAHSDRTEQRRFLRATGMTHGTIRQIERARLATSLLTQGVPILQVVHDAGYADQAHLTRSLRHYIGQTPLQVARGTEQLSVLFKTEAG